METARQCPSGSAVYRCKGKRSCRRSVCKIPGCGVAGGSRAGGDRGRSCGRADSAKARRRDISACMRILHEQYADNVPTTFEELLKLPGVGRKSANLIMGDVFGKPAIVTDTHCIRLCQSNRSGGRNQRTKKVGNGSLEDHSAGGGQ